MSGKNDRIRKSFTERKIKFLLVNALTLSRFFLTIFFIKLLLKNTRSFGLSLIIFILIILTDFYDGRLARKWSVESRLGNVLDVAADFFFIFFTSLALYQKNIFPLWMIWVILTKFVEFIITSFLLNRKKSLIKKNYFVFDLIGRSLAICLYFLPIITISFLFVFGKEKLIVLQIPILLSVFLLAVISSVQRIYFCLNSYFKFFEKKEKKHS